MLGRFKKWLIRDTTPPPVWVVPVRLRSRQKIGMFTRSPGATVDLPGWQAIYLERRGLVEILLPSIDLQTFEMHDPTAAPPDPNRRPASW